MATSWQQPPLQEPPQLLQGQSWFCEWDIPHSTVPTVALPPTTKESFPVFSRQRWSRVTKPSSAGTSPRSTTRRRTLHSESPTYYQRLLGHRNSPYPIDTALLTASLLQQNRSRPVSWHPSSFGYVPTTQTVSVQNPWGSAAMAPVSHQPQSTEIFGTAAVNGLVTPVACPVPGDSISSEYLAPLDTNNYGFSVMPQQTPYTPSESMSLDSPVLASLARALWDGDACAAPLVTDTPEQCWIPTDPLSAVSSSSSLSSSSSSSMDRTIPYAQVFPLNLAVQNPMGITAPPTPEGFPIQPFDNILGDGADILSTKTPPGEELVGMGLYDGPEEVALCVDLNSDVLANGKGLKLEETFSPPPVPEEDDDEVEADGEDDDEVVKEEDEHEYCNDDNYNGTGNGQHLETLQYVGKSGSLSGQTFFFEED